MRTEKRLAAYWLSFVAGSGFFFAYKYGMLLPILFGLGIAAAIITTIWSIYRVCD